MKNKWLFLMDLDGGSPNMFPVEPVVPHYLLSQISSFVDKSLYHSRYMHVPGSLALQEAFNCISKFACALLLWFASGSNSNINHKLQGNSHGSNLRSCKSSTQVNHITFTRHNLAGFFCNSGSKGESAIPVIFRKISSFTVRQLCKEAEQLQSFPVLSLAAALVPPFDNVSRNVLAVPLEDIDIKQRCMYQSPCEVEHRGCADLSSLNLNCTRLAVEPRTGIEFPTKLDNMVAGETNSSLLSEVLVGTGSRTMRIIKIKSLKVYAFGFYVHPYDICEKLGPKYASIPSSDVNKNHIFYEDLLRLHKPPVWFGDIADSIRMVSEIAYSCRNYPSKLYGFYLQYCQTIGEDINMTVRLVVSCNGMKINTVKDAFEKSLRARLTKTNPDTDYDCLRTFGSLFSQDIPISVGTTIDFRRTAEGHLVTEIGGNQIGTVHSKDLCRAFFDMYIGNVPVCEETKEEIGRNVASIIRRC